MDCDTCPSSEELRQFNCGLLAEERLEPIGRHIDSCSRCEAQLSTFCSDDSIGILVRRQADPGVAAGSALKHAQELIQQLSLNFHQCCVQITQQPTSFDSELQRIKRMLEPSCDPQEIGRLGHYRIFEVLGEGGMGIVFRAEDTRLHRPVALKVLRPEIARSDEMTMRMQREAITLATVQHDSIVPIYEISIAQGIPYIAMKFIAGNSLAREIADGPMQPVRAARMVLESSQAIAYSHSLGVIHRDLKPANILVDPNDRAMVTDFGLAKQLSGVEGGSEHVTREGQLLGTPGFMAPEQAGGQNDEIGPAVDIYSLGATLYALITGRPPFQAASVLDTLQQARFAIPVSPRTLNPAVPRDLDTICMKCLEKSPAKRFASTHDLVEELGRFLVGRPIKSRPVSTATHLILWARSNPLLCTLLSTVSLLLMVLGIASIWGTIFFRELAESERKARVSETQQKSFATQATRARDIMLSDIYSKIGVSTATTGNANEALVWFATAAQYAGDDQQRQLANRIRVANWSKRAFVPSFMAQFKLGYADKVAMHSSGRYLLASSIVRDQVVQILPLDAKDIIPQVDQVLKDALAAEWSPDGSQLCVITQDSTKLYSFPETQKLIDFPAKGRFACLRFSLSGRYLATSAGRRVLLFDLTNMSASPRTWNCSAFVRGISFTPDSNLLAVYSSDNLLRITKVDAGAGNWSFPPIPHDSVFSMSALPPLEPIIENDFLVTVHDRFVTQSDTKNGQKIRVLAEFPQQAKVTAMTSDAGGRHVVVAGPPAEINVYDSRDGKLVHGKLKHRVRNRISHLDVARNAILSSGHDHTVRLWSLTDGQLIYAPLEHSQMVSFASFCPNDEAIITADRSGLISIFKMPSNLDDVVVQLGTGPSLIRSTLDGRYVIPSGSTKQIPRIRRTRVIDTNTGQSSGFMSSELMINDACASPNGQRVVVGLSNSLGLNPRANSRGRVHQIQVFDTSATPPTPLHVQDFSNQVRSLDFKPDGEEFAVLETSGTITLFDSETCAARIRLNGAPLVRSGAHNLWNGALRYHPDGKSLAVFATLQHAIEVWDTTSGERLTQIEHLSACSDFKFSERGEFAAASNFDGDVYVWETGEWKLVFQTRLADRCGVVCFSPCNRWLATGCLDGSVRVFDFQSGDLVALPIQHDAQTMAVEFSRDGEYLITGGYDGTLAVRHLKTSELMCQPIALGTQILNLKTLHDGRVAVGGTQRSCIVNIPQLLRPFPLEGADLRSWAELVSRKEVNIGGTVSLTSTESFERWLNVSNRSVLGTH